MEKQNTNGIIYGSILGSPNRGHLFCASQTMTPDGFIVLGIQRTDGLAFCYGSNKIF